MELYSRRNSLSGITALEGLTLENKRIPASIYLNIYRGIKTAKKKGRRLKRLISFSLFFFSFLSRSSSLLLLSYFKLVLFIDLTEVAVEAEKGAAPFVFFFCIVFRARVVCARHSLFSFLPILSHLDFFFFVLAILFLRVTQVLFSCPASLFFLSLRWLFLWLVCRCVSTRRVESSATLEHEERSRRRR